MHAAHFLTRAALRHPHRPAWSQGDTVVTFRQAEAREPSGPCAPVAGRATRRPGRHADPQLLPYGKILKRELRERYWTGRDRRV